MALDLLGLQPLGKKIRKYKAAPRSDANGAGAVLYCMVTSAGAASMSPMAM